MSADSGTAAPSTSDASSAPAAAQRKPHFALFIATACGLGYSPIAPGTWGSLVGYSLLLWYFRVAAITSDWYRFAGLRQDIVSEFRGWS